MADNRRRKKRRKKKKSRKIVLFVFEILLLAILLVDDIAFIVNVPSKTVVTAMDQAETNSNVFTNIDGAVIM